MVTPSIVVVCVCKIYMLYKCISHSYDYPELGLVSLLTKGIKQGRTFIGQIILKFFLLCADASHEVICGAYILLFPLTSGRLHQKRDLQNDAPVLFSRRHTSSSDFPWMVDIPPTVKIKCATVENIDNKN